MKTGCEKKKKAVQYVGLQENGEVILSRDCVFTDGDSRSHNREKESGYVWIDELIPQNQRNIFKSNVSFSQNPKAALKNVVEACLHGFHCNGIAAIMVLGMLHNL